jgi:WD40 repeat protein
VLKKLTGHTVTVTCAAYIDKDRAISGSDDGTVRMWNLADGKTVGILKGHAGAVRSLAVKPGGRWAITGSSDRTLRLWDLNAKAEAAVFRKHGGPVIAAAFLANGTQTLSGDRELGVFPWKIDRFLTGAALKPQPPAPLKPPAIIPLAKP